MRRYRGMWWCLLAATGAVFAQDTATQPPVAPDAALPAEYGLSAKHAIEVCEPEGQRLYLARLICPDSTHPTFERAGNVGMRNEPPAHASEAQEEQWMADMFKPRELAPGEVDYHIVDRYEVACGKDRTELYLDMYHCAQARPAIAPQGFTIIE